MNDNLIFIKMLEQFCKSADACQRITLHHLDYIESNGYWWLYIFVGTYGHSEKRVNVTGNSKEGIARAFFDALGHWDDYPYLVHTNTFKELLEA